MKEKRKNMKRGKEINFFGLEGRPNNSFIEKYKIMSFEDYKKLFKKAKKNQLLGDFSINLLCYPKAIEKSDKAYLVKIYKENIKRLEELLNRDLSHWLK